MTSSNPRRDAVQNRALLVAAARSALAEIGADVPLEQIAQRAGVSRTTLHRHFSDRDHLLAAVFDQNVEDIEIRSAAESDRADGVIRLFHEVLALQIEVPALSRALSRRNTDVFSALSSRVKNAFEKLMPEARRHGLLHPGITTSDVMIAFPMAAAAILEDDLAGRRRAASWLAALLHRGLFTTPPPGPK